MKEKRLQKQITMHKDLVSEYDRRYAPQFSKLFQVYWNQEILKKLLLPRGALVLDLGCGTGILLKNINLYGYKAFGLDISHAMLSRATGISPVVVGDGGHLPFCDASFDAVVTRGSIHHIPNILAVLKEIRRILKRGGQSVISEPSNDSIIVRMARSILYRKNRHFDVEDEGFRSQQIYSLMKAAGFEVLGLYRFGFFSYTFAGFPDILPFMKFVPFNSALTRILIVVDRVLARTPIIGTLSLHLIIQAWKP